MSRGTVHCDVCEAEYTNYTEYNNFIVCYDCAGELENEKVGLIGARDVVNQDLACLLNSGGEREDGEQIRGLAAELKDIEEELATVHGIW